jgi:hypothetical protein
MRTLIVSDLHLGGLSGIDLLRRPQLREPLLEALDGIERLVLLGDVLELRHGPPHEALAASRPFFEDVGRALGDGELVVTAGNHDHLLVGCWLDARALGEPAPQPLGLEQRIAPGQASPMLARIEQWARPARVQAAYPGLWLRPDVYATHGHYLDCHLTIPTLERLGIGAMGRLLERSEDGLSTVEGYEAITAPIYAWRDAMARYARTGPALNGVGTMRAWRALGGGARTGGEDAPGAPNGVPRRRGRGAVVRATGASLRGRAFKGAFPLVVSAVNRAGMGPVSTDISRGELRRAGLRAMAEVATRLRLQDAYLIFGHTHRAGPFAGDHEAEWRGARVPAPDRSGVRLVNSGCWTYDSLFLTPIPGESPYWPGTCVLVEDSGPPVLERLLQTRSHAELAPIPVAVDPQADPTRHQA